MALKDRLKIRLKYVAENLTLHGIKFLVSEAHIGYKIIWLTVLILFAFSMQKIILTTLSSSKDDSIIVNIDTNYLKWENRFPSVAICFRKDRSFDNLKNFLDEYFRDTKTPKPKNVGSYYKFAQSYAFMAATKQVKDIDMKTCLAFNDTCGLNLDVIQKKAMPVLCSDFMIKVMYLGKKMKCDDIFKLEYTSVGICFSTAKPLIYSRKTEHRIQLSIEYREPEGYGFDLYIYSPGESVTNWDTAESLPKEKTEMYIGFKTLDTTNHKEVKSVDPEIRDCKFSEEHTDLYKFPYSYANCIMEQRIKGEIDACNCTLPIIKKRGLPYCKIHGLNCLKSHNISEVAKKCLHLCTEMEITKTGDSMKEKATLQGRGVVILETIDQPTSRYVRSLITKDLDLIVICASVVGLFTGASLLSGIEILYMFIIRKYKDM